MSHWQPPLLILAVLIVVPWALWQLHHNFTRRD